MLNYVNNLKRPIYIWGAGIAGIKIYRLLKTESINVGAFIDRNSLLWNSQIEGVEVLSPNDIEIKLLDEKPYIILGTADNKSIKEKLEGLGYIIEKDFSDHFVMPFTYDIDVVGLCNLSCPSCPIGNSKQSERPSGLYMDLQLFEQIVLKIKRETPVIGSVGLFNWAEPLLHPNINKIIEILKSNGIKSRLSSNLNLIKNLEHVIKAGPDELRISLSGFHQDTYTKTHRNGKIENVKENMRQLRKVMNQHESNTYIEVLYHMYRHNMDDDFVMMKNLCEELSFQLTPVFAFLMPVEKNIDYYNGTLNEEDHELVDMLIHSPQEHKEISLNLNEKECVLRAHQTAINVDGSVALCCGVFDKKHTISRSFLDTNFVELQLKKYKQSFCNTCMSHGIHSTAVYAGIEELNKRAQKVLGDSFIKM